MLTKDIIKKRFAENGLLIDKIVRTKLNDGWYIYHQCGMEGKRYKPAKIISRTENAIIKQVQPYIIRRDFIEDDNEMMLDITIMEAKHRRKDEIATIENLKLWKKRKREMEIKKVGGIFNEGAES